MNLAHSIQCIKELINHTAHLSHRESGSILLLAVSKRQSVEVIQKAYDLGITQFGENYYQEAIDKIQQLHHLKNIKWHFIGPIQSNKTKGIAQHFDWVHSINRYAIAQRLNDQRDEDAAPLNVCIQINLIHEPSKSGITADSAYELANQIAQLPQLKLRGLMTIPPPQINEAAHYELFLRLKELMNSLNEQLGLDMDTLSMGMSNDLIPAIKAGATIVRIGSALFGERR